MAPIIFFDDVNAYGAKDGIVFVVLTADTPLTDSNKTTVRPVVPVAHLRMGRSALFQLKAALDKIILRMHEPASMERN